MPESSVPLHLQQDVRVLVWLQVLVLEATCSIHITTSQSLPLAALVLQEMARLPQLYPRMLQGLAPSMHLLAGDHLPLMFPGQQMLSCS